MGQSQLSFKSLGAFRPTSKGFIKASASLLLSRRPKKDLAMSSSIVKVLKRCLRAYLHHRQHIPLGADHPCVWQL